jgi:hypothetical protein
MTAFIGIDSRGGLRSFGGSQFALVNRWCTTWFKRDLIHFAQTLTIRFNGANMVLRLISKDRLLVRLQIFQAGTRIANVAFRIDPQQQRAFLSWTVLTPATQRTGAFKHILQNILLVLRDCGISRIGLVASLTHGGYVWAIYGFLPETAAEWARLAGVLRRKLLAVASQLKPAELDAVQKLLASPDPLALRAIAGSAIPIGDKTLGKHLLMGTEWKGELDFSDSPAVLIYLKRIGVMP